MSTVKNELLQKDLLGLAKRNELTREGDVIAGQNKVKKNDITVHIADVWGFCYGVLYAIEAVGEVLEDNPDKKVWVLGELIHNNHVNNELREMGAHFIEPDEVKEKAGPDDLVVVPAFGTKKEIFEYLEDTDHVTVDTTCPEVRDVEEEVSQFNEQDLTTIIHGKHEHQESIATSSFANEYLIVRDEEETEKVCDFIRNGGNPDEFMREFDHATSENFDPTTDLEKIGLANQTTMLMDESVKIFEMIEEAVQDRDGHDENVETIDTICSATQDRQDAVNMLASNRDFDLFLIVGGFHSSNTKNLARSVVNKANIPTYHIEEPDSFDKNKILHLSHDSTEPTETRDWLPDGEISVGLTAGASTPHSDLEAILKKLLSFY